MVALDWIRLGAAAAGPRSPQAGEREQWPALVARKPHDVLAAGGGIRLTQVKNHARNPITLAIPIIPALQDIIDMTPGTGDAFLMNELRRPFTAAGFGNWFRDRCVEAGVPGRAHGLRKAAASRLAELGCSDREIMAITGHTTSKEVDRYTKGARQRVLAASAMRKMSGGRHLKAV